MTTRAQIVEFLERNGLSTSDEVGRFLQIPPANVRHHLRDLRAEGVVDVVDQRSAGGRGRPARLYALTNQAKSHNLDALASAALDAYLAHLPPDLHEKGLQEIASRIATPVISAYPGSLTKHLTQTVRRLNELRYQARWEAHREAPRLILGHCPYAAILAAHPELCQLDALIIRNLLDVPARQVKKLARDARGARYCLFLIEQVK